MCEDGMLGLELRCVYCSLKLDAVKLYGER